ncbi:hypothetical protein LC608_20025 [Nostoc sp. XA010]|uniref:hypothetical protein n=1 Tax=Nostoc sp. XA010 TaxID=2780407 RepID=UPI001E50B261|nr:hypothetical protein [Nostoc sp. XA010]MCC5659223.1 hypothetical protein [Nostoc sp. XA010]
MQDDVRRITSINWIRNSLLNVCDRSAVEREGKPYQIGQHQRRCHGEGRGEHQVWSWWRQPASNWLRAVCRQFSVWQNHAVPGCHRYNPAESARIDQGDATNLPMRANHRCHANDRKATRWRWPPGAIEYETDQAVER